MNLMKRVINRWRKIMAPSFVNFEGGFMLQKNVKFGRSSGEIHLGDGAALYRNTEILAPVKIGSSTYLNRDCYVRAGTTIGNHVSVGPFTRFITDSHEIGPSDHRAGATKFDPIVVEDGVWIGACVTILGGVRVGRGSVIAAGAVVVRDVPDNVLVAGIPARVLKELDR